MNLHLLLVSLSLCFMVYTNPTRRYMSRRNYYEENENFNWDNNPNEEYDLSRTESRRIPRMTENEIGRRETVIKRRRKILPRSTTPHKLQTDFPVKITTTTTTTAVPIKVSRDSSQLPDHSGQSTFLNIQKHPSSFFAPSIPYSPPHLENGFFAQIVRFLLSIPNFTLSLLRPFLIGAVDLSAKATHTAGDIQAHVVQFIPAITESSADISKKLIETFGEAGTNLLHVLIQLTYGAAAAQRTAAAYLPLTLNIVNEANEIAAKGLGTVAQGLADTTHVVAGGVLDAARIKGHLVSNLVDGNYPTTFRHREPHGNHIDINSAEGWSFPTGSSNIWKRSGEAENSKSKSTRRRVRRMKQHRGVKNVNQSLER